MPDTPSGTPALDFLLAEHADREIDGTPFGCSTCPLAQPSENANPSDPDEGYYPCTLLGEVIWGESPQCTPDLWRAEARRELEARS